MSLYLQFFKAKHCNLPKFFRASLGSPLYYIHVGKPLWFKEREEFLPRNEHPPEIQNEHSWAIIVFYRLQQCFSNFLSRNPEKGRARARHQEVIHNLSVCENMWKTNTIKKLELIYMQLHTIRHYLTLWTITAIIINQRRMFLRWNNIQWKNELQLPLCSWIMVLLASYENTKHQLY
jgi:hypothetical protein